MMPLPPGCPAVGVAAVTDPLSVPIGGVNAGADAPMASVAFLGRQLLGDARLSDQSSVTAVHCVS
jgi:hypothetical protein